MDQLKWAALILGTMIIVPVCAQEVSKSETPPSTEDTPADIGESTTPPIPTISFSNDFFLSSPNPRYQDCIDRIAEDPEIGREAAREWMLLSHDPKASHCLAVADLAAGYPKLSALRLLELAESDASGDAPVRARLYAQAAEIWLATDEPEEASKAIGGAFALVPDAGETFLLAGRIHAANKRWQATIDAIDAAENLSFASASGYRARARAYKELTRFEDAADDVAAALRLDPFDLDTLVLRGELAQVGIVINTNYKRREPDHEASP